MVWVSRVTSAPDWSRTMRVSEVVKPSMPLEGMQSSPLRLSYCGSVGAHRPPETDSTS